MHKSGIPELLRAVGQSFPCWLSPAAPPASSGRFSRAGLSPSRLTSCPGQKLGQISPLLNEITMWGEKEKDLGHRTEPYICFVLPYILMRLLNVNNILFQLLLVASGDILLWFKTIPLPVIFYCLLKTLPWAKLCQQIQVKLFFWCIRSN